MKLFLICSLVLGIFFKFTNASAQSTRAQTSRISGKGGGLFDVALYHGQTEATNDPNNIYQVRSNESYYDMKLGYVFGMGLYLGAQYATRNSGYLGGSTTGNGAGAGLGYFFQNGINLRAYYRFNESFNDFRNGTGSQFDAGFSELFATNFYLGILMSYRKTNYTSRDFDPTLTRYSFESVYPMLTVGFLIN